MKFAHTGDCHLGGWRQPELAELNLQSFTFFVDTCLKEKVDFVLIAGDFFDSAYPPIEAIKHAFEQLRRLKDVNVPVFMIAGSHDYSASGKSFIEVMEKAGFVKNAFQGEERGDALYLTPHIYKGVAIYGYPGKRSALEVETIKRIRLHETPGLFTILMLHTALRDAVGNLPIPAVDHEKLPRTDYLALAHLHVKYEKNGRVYCGPLFPNNVGELEELRGGSFYIADTKGKLERKEVKLKQVLVHDIKIEGSFVLSDALMDELTSKNFADKIALIRLVGYLDPAKTGDVQLNELETFLKKKGAYAVLKDASGLRGGEAKFIQESSSEVVESALIDAYKHEHPAENNIFIEPLMHVLSLEKKEEEKALLFDERLFEEFRKAVLQ